jgi:hypothetical protein
LLFYPLKVSGQRLVRQQFLKQIKGFGQNHFVIFAMDPAVTRPTYPDPRLQGVFTVLLPEVCPAMYFFRYQVVKGERNRALAAGTELSHGWVQLFALGSAV